MNSFLKSIFIILSALIICSCSEKDPEPDSLVITSLGQTEAIFSKGGSQTSVSFTTNVPWSTTVDYQGGESGWVVLSPSSGSAGDIKISVTVASNAGYDSRSAEITITAGTCIEKFKITQSQKDGMTLTSDKESEFACEGGTLDVTLSANVKCNATTQSDWLTVDPTTKALVDKTFTITVQPNQTYYARTDSVMFTSESGDFIEKVIISQAQKDVFSSQDASYDFSCEKAEFEAEVMHNVDFEVTTSQEWISYEKGAPDDYTLTTPLSFKVEKNETYSSRSGEVKISSPQFDHIYTITVNQAQSDVLSLDDSPHSIGTEGGQFAVSVLHNIPFVCTTPEWISHSKGTFDPQTMTTQLNFSADENTSNDPRSGTIIVTDENGGREYSISVLQEGQLDVVVEIPDAAFKAYVLANFDTNNDGVIKIGEANLITNIDCHQMGIVSLQGIETFVNLEKLVCNGNKIKTMELSANTKLARIECSKNQLTTLKVAAGTALSYLDCSNNLLTSLDLAACPSIITLHCYKNRLTALNTSKITELLYLIASDNLLNTFDGSANTHLKQLGLANNLLTSIKVPSGRTLESLNLRNNRFVGTLELTTMAKNNAIVYCSGNPYVENIDSLLVEEWPDATQRLNELILNLDTSEASVNEVDPWTKIKYIIVIDGGIE